MSRFTPLSKFFATSCPPIVHDDRHHSPRYSTPTYLSLVSQLCHTCFGSRWTESRPQGYHNQKSARYINSYSTYFVNAKQRTFSCYCINHSYSLFYRNVHFTQQNTNLKRGSISVYEFEISRIPNSNPLTRSMSAGLKHQSKSVISRQGSSVSPRCVGCFPFSKSKLSDFCVSRPRAGHTIAIITIITPNNNTSTKSDWVDYY